MKVFVTGSSGHLGEALMRTLDQRHDLIGLDLTDSPFTTVVGDITDRDLVGKLMSGVDTVYHTATLHKPHVATHSKSDFIQTNIQGTLNLLEAALEAGVRSFIFTSTTSTFGDALKPPADQPAAWIDETVSPVPKNIYGVTKTAAEDLCQLFWRNHKLPCLVLRTSRFFPEDDDNATMRANYSSDNAKANEFLYRRASIDDMVSAHLVAAERAPEIGFGKYIISATTPFRREDLPRLRNEAAVVLKERFPQYEAIYQKLGWRMFPGIDRVYDSSAARTALGWQPKDDFAQVLERVVRGESLLGPLAERIGKKGYHEHPYHETKEGPYPVKD